MTKHEMNYVRIISDFIQIVLNDPEVSIEFKTKLLELRKQL